MVEVRQEPLAEGYYLDNFWQILRAASSLYADLLSAQERSFLADFEALSLGAQRLYVRLLSRRGDCFRLDRIEYREIPDIPAALEELKGLGFAGEVEALALDGLLHRLLRAELGAILKGFRPELRVSQLKKGALIEALLGLDEEQRLRQEIAGRVPMVRLLRWELTLAFRLMMFGSLSYDLTDFVLQDLGVVVYESYPILREHRLYPSRKALDERLWLSQIGDGVSILLEAEATEQAIEWARPVVEHEGQWEPTSLRSANRILTRIGRVLERREEYDEALRFFEAATAPPSRERRARICLGLGRLEEAWSLCQEMQAEPRDETEAPVAQRIADKIRKARQEPVPKRKRRRRPQFELQLEKLHGAVEQRVLEHFEALGQPGFHGENGLWLGLFGLAFWEVLFAPLPGAFQHPFQRGPLDLYHPEFASRRREAIEAKLSALRSPGWQEPLLRCFHQKQGLANAFVPWDWLSLELLTAVLEVLPGAHLATVCQRLVRDIRRYRRGFPDLFVLTDEGPGYRLIEVKGPGDQLRPEQSAWLDAFADAGIPASIARVKWVG